MKSHLQRTTDLVKRLRQKTTCQQCDQKSERNKQTQQLVTDELKSYWIRGAQQPRGNLQKLIVASEGAHLAAELPAYPLMGNVPGTRSRFEHHPFSGSHYLHRDLHIVEQGLVWNHAQQFPSHAVECASRAYDRTRSGLELPHFLLHRPVQAHVSAFFSRLGIAQH